MAASLHLAVVLSLTLWMAGSVVYMARYTPAQPYSIPAEDLQRVRDAKIPVVVFDAHGFLKMHHYLPPHLRDKIFHLVDSELSIEYAKNDTNYRTFENLKPFVRLNVPRLCDFTKLHHRFLIFMVRRSWEVSKLIEDGAAVTLINPNSNGHAWLSVKLNGPSGC